MRAASALLCAVVVFAPSALSQSSPSLDGIWLGRVALTGGRAGEVEMTVRGTEGTWRLFRSTGSAGTQMKDDPCLDRAHPIAITPLAPDRYRLVVEASKTLSGCRDSKAEFAVFESNRIDGQFAGGRERHLKRK